MKNRLLLFHAVCIWGIHIASVNMADGQVAVDVTVTDAGPLSYVTPGTYAVTPTVESLDIDYAISFLNANWQLDGGEVHTTFIDDFMLYGDLYPGFKSRMVLDSITFTTTGTHTLKIWTDTPGGFPDTNPANDTAWINITVCDSLPEKNVLIWYGTHVDCFPCGGYGEEMIDSINSMFPDQALLIRAHDEAGDPYVCDESTMLNNLYIWPYSGHPSWVFDQFTFPYFDVIVPYELFSIQWVAVEWRLDYRYPISVTITDTEIDTITNLLTANVNATFYADYTGALNINAVISEDSIYGPQDGYPGGYMYHSHVMRSMTAGVEGETGIIPFNAVAGETYVYPITQTLDSAWNKSQLYLTGYVALNNIDPLKRPVLNAERIRLNKTKTEEDTTVQVAVQDLDNTIELHIYPNPASSIITVEYNNSGSDVMQVDIYASDGRKVFSDQPVPAGMNGKTQLEIPVSGFNNGIYLIHIRDHDLPVAGQFVVIEH